MNAVQFAYFLGLKLFCMHEEHIQGLRLLKFESILETLPNLTEDFITLTNGKKLYAGTIIQRPLKYLSVPDDFLHHEGVVLGTANNREVILEMNDLPRNGINVVDMKGFLSKYDSRYFDVKYEPTQPIELNILIERARKYDRRPYSVTTLNCMDFAHWLVFGKTILSFKEKQLEKCDDLILLYKTIISDSQSPTKEDWIRDLDEVLKRKDNLALAIKEFKGNSG